MSIRICLIALLLGGATASQTVAQGYLQMGMNGIGWEAAVDTGPLLYREVNESALVSVRAKISAQTAGFWSQAGVIVRAPNPIDGAAAQENWMSSWSFRAPALGPFTHQSNMHTLGVEAEINNGDLTADDLSFVRIDNMGGGTFLAYRGSGPDDNITWTPIQVMNDDTMMLEPAPQSNINLSGGTLQVGLAAGALGALASANVAFDWVEIETTTQTFRDDFLTVHDYTSGVPGGSIWTGVENAAAGGTNTISGPNAGRCLECTRTAVGSGNFATLASWSPVVASVPNGNDVAAIFGDAITEPQTVFNNQHITLKEIRFDNANKYVFGGPGSVTLDADAGNAEINVLQGSHEIQVALVLADNVVATAAGGAELNINAAVYLNGNAFNTNGTVNLNNGTILSGTAGGAGLLVNDGELAGLASLQGDFAQSAAASLAVVAGGESIQVAGSAELAGTLDVSLANGFTPRGGQSYTVLTADSVSNLGLSLSGDAAGLFNLAVDGTSVSLVAVPIPEPSTLSLAGLAAIVGACRRRRRRSTWVPSSFTPGRRPGLLIAAGVASLLASTAWAQTWMPAGTYRDDFGDNNTMEHDYNTGMVPNGGIWAGIHNAGNGGTPENPGFFVADGFDFNGEPKFGQLFIEDLVIHPNTDPNDPGIGWEANGGGINNAPFLFGTVAAEHDFEAVIKIDAQTAGSWSYTTLMARVAGPPVGLGRGDEQPDPPENFVTIGSFRTNPDIPENATILMQSIQDNAETESQSGVIAALPLWVRMEKSGSQFTAHTSVDGEAWTQQQSMINPNMSVEGATLEVGLGHWMHSSAGGAAYGFAEIDFFEISVVESEPPIFASWNPPAAAAGSGNWMVGANWDSSPAGSVPNANTYNVHFDDAISGPSTVFVNEAVTVRSITFDNANKYAISGAGSISLQPDPVFTPGNMLINVVQGSHEVQVPIRFGNAASTNTSVTAASGSRLDFNNSVNLEGRTLHVTGGGEVNFNNRINTGTTGTVRVESGGLVGGNGRINGNLQNGFQTTPGGTVSPGQSIGTLTVGGTFSQTATGTLAIELGGTAAGQYDVLTATGSAVLGGALHVSLINGFVPTGSDTFTILTANARAQMFASASLIGAEGTFDVMYTSNSVVLHNFNVTGVGTPGDFNADGVVDAADYTHWRDTGGTPSQFNEWKSNFGAGQGSGTAVTQAAAVPEPGAAALLLLAVLLAPATRRYSSRPR